MLKVYFEQYKCACSEYNLVVAFILLYTEKCENESMSTCKMTFKSRIVYNLSNNSFSYMWSESE